MKEALGFRRRVFDARARLQAVLKIQNYADRGVFASVQSGGNTGRGSSKSSGSMIAFRSWRGYRSAPVQAQPRRMGGEVSLAARPS
jgi:hypothetical protein